MSKQKGQTLVEFALILPVVLLAFFMIIESGRLFHAYITVQHAARVGARYAITGQRDSNCKWWWDGTTPSADELRVCSVMDVAWSQMGALAINPTAVAWNDPGHMEIHVYALRRSDPSDPSTWHVEDGYAGEPNEKVTVQVSYRLEIITPFLRPIAESVPVWGQAEMINENFGQVGGAGFEGARVPPAPFEPPTPGPSPTPCPPITLTLGSLIEGASQVEVATGSGMPVTVYDMTASEQEIGNGTSPGGSSPVSFTIPVSPVLVAGHVIRAQQSAACTEFSEGTVEGLPTPTFTPSPSPTPTETPEPCPVEISEPLVAGETRVIVFGEVGETVVIRDLSEPGAPTLGALELTGDPGHCTGLAAIPVDPSLIADHTIVALGPTSSDWATVLAGPPTPTATPTGTNTPTATPTPTGTGTPTPTVAATATPRDSYIVIEPTCGPAGQAQSVLVRGVNWPTNKGSIRVRWDGVEPDRAIIDPPLSLWMRTINLSAGDTTEGTHTIWAGVLEPPYTFDQKNFEVPCPGTPTLTPTPTPTETTTPTPTATPVQADLTIGNFGSSGNQTWVPVTFTVRVDNIGIGGVNDPFWVGLFVNPVSPPSGGDLGDDWEGVSSLAAGASTNLTLEYIFTATGTYPVYAYADTSQVINETNEDNNDAGPINVVVNVMGETPTPTATPTETTVPVTPGSIDGTTFVFLGGELRPLGRVNVFLYRGGDLVDSTVSNDAGYYQLTSVEPYTNYTVVGQTEIDGTTYADTRLPVVVESGQNTTVSLLLLPQ